MAAYFDDPRLYQYLHEGSIDPIFRKISKSRVLAIYLPKRELWDNPSSRFSRPPMTDAEKYRDNPFERCIVQGIVGVNTDYIVGNNKVFVEVNAYFRYDKNEVNPFEFNVKRLIFRAYKQVYPMEDVLLKQIDMDEYCQSLKALKIKLGDHYYPFIFDLTGSSDSAWIHDFKAPKHNNGVYWEVRAYTNDLPELKPPIDNLVRMKIRKLTFVDIEYIPNEPKPYATIDRQYASLCLDGGAINLQTELNKYLYYTGEEIMVSVGVTNASNRVIKKIYVAVEQILKFDFWEYKEYVVIIQDKSVTDEHLSIPVLPKNECWIKNIPMQPSSLCPTDPVNLVVETPNHPDFTNINQVCLAATTLSRDELDVLFSEKYPDIEKVEHNKNIEYENPLHVRYQVAVTCEISPSGNGLEGEAPRTINEFILCHPKPHPKPPMRVQAPKPY